MFTKDSMKYSFGEGMSKTLPGLSNFYMTGQWVEPGGGVPTSAISARKLIKWLCKQDGQKFDERVKSSHPSVLAGAPFIARLSGRSHERTPLGQRPPQPLHQPAKAANHT
jgi:hypothetical protein